MTPKYDNFIFFSAGPVGDHVLLIDFANYLFEQTKTPSLLILKHPNPFLKELSLPYHSHISHLDYVSFRGVARMAVLALKSLLQKNCYILVFPVPPPTYLILFSLYIRFCTRSRIVGFNLEGTKSFAIGKGYKRFLGESNTIPLLPEMYYKSVNRMLTFLGFKESERLPKLDYLLQEDVFERFSLEKQKYLVMHIKASHPLRSLPPSRWNFIIKEVIKKAPNAQLVFTGAKGDIPFIKEALSGVPEERYSIVAGETTTQQLLTLYAHAKVNVTVQTGNGLIINLLHVPTVVVNIKGTAMFYYDFNKQATILYSEKDCRCNPFETECNMVSYEGEKYMACLFNIKDEAVIEAVLAKYNA